jgi:hypothetical protein
MKKNKNGYYITYFNQTEKVEIEPQEEIRLFYTHLIKLVLPECKTVLCFNNYLTELIIPHGCEYVSCSSNNLTKLILPKTCKVVSCYDNQLTKLIVPKICTDVHCHSNNLPQLIINLLQSKEPVKIQLANNLQIFSRLSTT